MTSDPSSAPRVTDSERHSVREPKTGGDLINANDRSGIDCGEPIYYQADAIPAWWGWLFALTLIFGPLYLLVNHSGNPNRTSIGSYEVALNVAMQAQFEQLGEVTVDRSSLIRFLDEPSWLQVGKSVFRSNCASCHGQSGEGMIGPNLCDDHYKNIRRIEDFLTVLNNGAAGGAMPAWRGKLTDTEIVLVSAYAASLRDTNPPGAKAAEGSELPPWDLTTTSENGSPQS